MPFQRSSYILYFIMLYGSVDISKVQHPETWNLGHTSFAMNAQDIMNAFSDSEYSVGNLGTLNNHDAQRKSAANLNVLERGK